MWIKQGRIFHIEESNFPGSSTYAQVPTPLVLSDRIRVYYANRHEGKAFIAYFDLAFDLKTILGDSNKIVLSGSKPGLFDADGQMPSCVIREGDEVWLYFIGWNKLSGEHARYQNEIGLAVSTDGGETFERMFEGSIMGRTPTEPGLAVMPFVMYKNWFRCWYQSGTGWTKVGEQYEPLYVIKYAKSIDGMGWDRHPAQCIQSDFPLEAFSRPSVFTIGDTYNMYFCFRDSVDYRGGKGSYRIGQASSNTGEKFTRDGWVLPLGEEGEWDSEMTAYPYVFEVNGKLVMLYNGNSFGQSGIGIAVWENVH